MKPTIGQHYKLLKLKLSEVEIGKFRFMAYTEGALAIATSEDKFFLVILDENLAREEIGIKLIYRATKKSILEVFGLWMQDLADNVENPSIKVDLLDLSYVKISDEDLKIIKDMG